jgi:hypothetical protein
MTGYNCNENKCEYWDISFYTSLLKHSIISIKHDLLQEFLALELPGNKQTCFKILFLQKGDHRQFMALYGSLENTK